MIDVGAGSAASRLSLRMGVARARTMLPAGAGKGLAVAGLVCSLIGTTWGLFYVFEVLF